MTFISKVKPTESELMILQILWDHGPSSVREVNDILNQSKEVGYTTTLKLMQIMNEKDLVHRNTESRSHIYSANVKRNETEKILVKGFVESAFQGSAMKLVMQVLGNHKASKEELDQIKSMIDKIETSKK